MVPTQLLERFYALKRDNPREAAEIAYVIASKFKDDGEPAKAAQFGRVAIQLLDGCEMETLEQCAAINTVVEGVSLPSYFHQEVVRDRLRGLDL